MSEDRALPRIAQVWAICLLLLLSGPGIGQAGAKEVRIGVLSFRAKEKTMAQWAPTASYLSRVIPGTTFTVVPMFYPEVDQAVAARTIDFVLTNTGHYVELEAAQGITRIATLVKMRGDKPLKVFGGVIFTRADRSDINSIADAANKRVLAVGKSSLGGFLVAWEQFVQVGLDPFTDFADLAFNGMPHDAVVMKVLAGEADVGTVRTGVIENLVREGKVRMGDLKILNQRSSPSFPYLLSTKLYPEWPFSRLNHVNDDLVEKVIVALLNIHADDPAARAGKYDRWSPPLDYQTVHHLMRVLHTGPYKDMHAFTVMDVFRKYWRQGALLVAVFLLGVAVLVKIIRLNRQLQLALEEVRRLSGILPICSSCKKIRNDQGYWNQVEEYISEHSDARFTHGICPDCLVKLYPDYAQKITAQHNP